MIHKIFRVQIKSLNRLHSNTNTKNNSQNNNINYFLLDQWHIKDIMSDTWYSIVKI